jgi:hypothetical protein
MVLFFAGVLAGAVNDRAGLDTVGRWYRRRSRSEGLWSSRPLKGCINRREDHLGSASGECARRSRFGTLLLVDRSSGLGPDSCDFFGNGVAK